jgi:hypothetical protein
MSEFDAVSRKFQALSRDLGGAGLRGVVTRVSVAAKKDIDAKVVRDLGSDRKFSNWGKFKFGSGFDLTSDSTSVVKPRPVGPWFVLEQGRKGKADAFPKGRRRRKVYKTPWGLRTATRASPWRSGKTKGKGTLTDATKEIGKRTPERIEAETLRAIGKHFRRGG